MTPAEVYLKYCSQLDLYKIGVSKNSKKRNKALQTGNPYIIETLHIFFSNYPYRLETSLHQEFKTQKIDVDENILKGEWFSLSKEQVSKFLNRCITIENNIKFLIDNGNYFILK